MPLPAHVQVYTVGGAVRDALLGQPVRDRDYVVVGATPEDMVAAGFRPVGNDFPVFLHPDTQAEYALARTERKTTRGYKGFQIHSAPDVSLADDLARRDLTINAMAMAADGSIIDPHGGRADLATRRLRHVSPAFAEDPVRILRIARFAARLPDFSIAAETLDLMRAMVAAGEVDALVPERVWQELARGLMESTPSRMLDTLRTCGALARLLPEVDRLYGVPQPPQHHAEIDTGIHVGMVLDAAAGAGLPLPARWACLLHDLGKGLTPAADWPRHIGHEARGTDLARAVSERLRAPADCRDLAVLVAREHGLIHRALELRPDTTLALLERCDALRRPERFDAILAACAADHQGRAGQAGRPYPQRAHLLQALAAAQTVDAGAIARAQPDRLVAAIAAARVAAIHTALPRQTPC